VSIRWPTVSLFPPLANLAQHAPELHCENPAGSRGRIGRRLMIPPTDLAAAFGVPTIPTAALRAVVVVDYRGQDGPSRWHALGAAQVLPLLRSHYLDRWLADDAYELARLRVDQDRLRQPHQQRLAAFAAQVKAAAFHPARDANIALQQGLNDLLG
jgi:hypothetical protein